MGQSPLPPVRVTDLSEGALALPRGVGGWPQACTVHVLCGAGARDKPEVLETQPACDGQRLKGVSAGKDDPAGEQATLIPPASFPAESHPAPDAAGAESRTGGEPVLGTGSSVR